MPSKLKRPKKGCNCLEQLNKELAPYNTRLKTELIMDFKTGKCRVVLPLPTQKINSKLRQPAKTCFGSYCPVCGKPLDKTSHKDTK